MRCPLSRILGTVNIGRKGEHAAAETINTGTLFQSLTFVSLVSFVPGVLGEHSITTAAGARRPLFEAGGERCVPSRRLGVGEAREVAAQGGVQSACDVNKTCACRGTQSRWSRARESPRPAVE